MATVTKQIEVEIGAKATYRHGELSLSLSATLPYGNNGRTATVTKVLQPGEDLQGIFEKIIADHQDDMLTLAEAGAAEALAVATRNKEL